MPHPLAGLSTLAALLLLANMLPAQSAPTPVTTLKLSAQLVYLDVTVLDRHNHPVTTGLTRDDFIITEDKQPQRIVSFEPPSAHTAPRTEAGNPEDDEAPPNNVPATIFVLDELNSTFEQVAYYRIDLKKYLESQPKQLAAPAELMVLSGYDATNIVQGFTRSREDLIAALDYVRPEIPNPDLEYGDRALKTLRALESIALEGMGAQGRKNVLWLGTGVAVRTDSFPEKVRTHFEEYMRLLTNTLVDGRLSLYVIFPGIEVNRPDALLSIRHEQDLATSVKDPYKGLVNFSNLARETGGTVYANENEANRLIARALASGLNYYTLTYQPQSQAMDSRFRQVRVIMRNPELRALTKTGYYSRDQDEVADPQRKAYFQISEAARSDLPLAQLKVAVETIVRHPDAGTVDFQLRLAGTNVPWTPSSGTGYSSTDIGAAGVALAKHGVILAYRMRQSHFLTASQDPAQLALRSIPLHLTLSIPRKLDHVRIVLRAMTSGQMGAADISSATIAAAPEAPTPEPQIPALTPRHPQPTAPATP